MARPKVDPEVTKKRARYRRLRQRGKAECTGCGKEKPFDETVVKTVRFAAPGTRKVLRARTVGQLCTVCLDKDPDFHLPKNYK